ncbi:MAG TPA: lipid A biosynthesis acyltransferase [Myxococcaceae bacterium]|nr:lipid A biosynthesis acyltransferase [Myxococcaceae bacterium]
MATPSLAKQLKRFLRYWAIRSSLSLLGLIPAKRAGRLGEAFGALAFALAGSERRKALEAIATAFPQLSEAARLDLARRCFRHLGRCAFEMACFREIDRAVESWVDWPQQEQELFRQAAARGRGVVLVTGHVGNWELLGRRIAREGIAPFLAVAKEATDGRLTELVDGFRARAGVESIWRGQEGSAKRLLRALRSGHILTLLIDQDTRVQSVFVPFFGQPAATPRAAADLALRTGASVVVGFCQRDGGGRYHLSTEELKLDLSGDRESDATAVTAALTARIEAAIRRAPEQWVWMHRRWKTRP